MRVESLGEALKAPNAVDRLKIRVDDRKLPEDLFELHGLTELTITGGKLETLSPRLAELEKLTALNLDLHPKLDLAAFPVLPALESLGLRNCKLRALPDTIFECKKLRWLSLGMNRLGTVPAAIGKLRDLQTLYLWGCRLEEVPPELGKLTDLRLLELEKNSLTALPKEIASLKNLVQLRIEKNQFEAIPPAIFELPCLELLEAYSNRITEIPAAISQLTRLKKLRLEDNPLGRFPADLSGLQALITFYLSFTISVEQLKQQIQRLPPRAFMMSFEYGDIARDGRWADEPARASSQIAKGAASCEQWVLHHENRVTSVALLPGAVAGAGYDALRVFDLVTGKSRFDSGSVRWVAASPDGATLLACGNDARLLDPMTGTTLRSVPGITDVQQAGWSGDGRILMLCTGQQIQICDVTSGKVVQTLRESQEIRFATLSPDGRRVLYGVKKAVRLWDRETEKELARVTVDGIGVRAGQFSPDGRRAFTLGYKDGIKVIDLDQKKPKAVAIGNTKPEVFCVLPDGKRAVIAGPKVEIVSLETGKILTTLGSHENEGPVDQVSVSTDGAQAASCGCDCTIRVWRLGE